MSYIGAAANIVGGELQGWANVLERHNMAQAFADEMNRQQGFRDQGQKVFNQAVAGQGAPTAMGDLSKGTADRQAAYEAVSGVPMEVQPNSTLSAPQTARDSAWAAMRGTARARLGSYSDWALNQTLRGIQTQEALRRVADTAGGDASVYPYKMYQAQHSMDDLAMVGAAISSIGGGAANYAQYAQGPQTSNMSQVGQGVFQDPYGVQYQVGPGGNIYSGQGQWGAGTSPIYNAYLTGQADPSLGAALSLG